MACCIVNTAKPLGIYTIVADYHSDSPAKKIADENVLLSTTDVGAIVSFCKKNQVDGVFSSFIESMLPYCCEICNELGLPFYATREQITIASNKYLFKDLCRKNNVPTVKEYFVNENLDDLSNLTYPVFIKPADNSGARGMSVVRNESELKRSYEKALNFSPCRKVLIEKYMDANCKCINIDYVICDGVFYLTGVGDKYVYRTQSESAPITSLVSYPSVYIDEYIETLQREVIKMFQSLDIKNGVIFIESFYDEEGFHFYEMGYRIGGGQYYVMLSKLYGIDFMKMMINFSLTGNMGCEKKIASMDPKFSQKCVGLVILLKKGRISAIEGIGDIQNLGDVVGITQILDLDDELLDEDIGTLRQAFARIHIVSDDKKLLRNTINEIYELLTVRDECQNNMIIMDLDSINLLCS